ncbi:hypothetical protein [Acrocarpospora sp. B8E8]|uniref:hypothetical protein n=1 Tax=Acrocarpospora sp. B8E8 TaxID=3153572 RepID=UPI00325F5861
MSLLSDFAEWLEDTVDELVDMVLDAVESVLDNLIEIRNWVAERLANLLSRVLRMILDIPLFGITVRQVLIRVTKNQVKIWDANAVGETAKRKYPKLEMVTPDRIQSILSQTPAFAERSLNTSYEEQRAINESLLSDQILTVEAPQ